MVDSSLELETGPWTEDSFDLQVVILTMTKMLLQNRNQGMTHNLHFKQWS